MISTATVARTAIMRQSTVANTISAPMRSTTGGTMRHAIVAVRAPKLPAVEVTRLPSEPARLPAK